VNFIHLPKRIFRTLRRLRAEDAGQTMVLAAVMMPILIGAVGIAVDVGYAFDHRRQMQLAADSAALAGGRALRTNPSISNADLATIVRADATRNKFKHGINSVSVTICKPAVDSPCPTQYTYVADNQAIKVTIDQPKSTFLIRVLGMTTMNIGVTAVASSSPTGASTANVIVLDDSCTSGAFAASGGVAVTVNGSMFVNSCDQNGTKASGGTPVNVSDGLFMGCSSTQCGGYQEQGGSLFTPAPTPGEPQMRDPLEDLPEPVPSGPTFNDPNINSGTHTLQPGIYNKGITIHGGNVTFAPGIYFLDDDPISIKGGATVTGTDVMFFAYNGAGFVFQDNSTTITMSAPTTGIYRGIWWFQARNNPKDDVITAGPLINITGTFYISHPDSELSMSGNSASGMLADYTVFVVWHFAVNGGATFNSDFASIGGTPLKGFLALAE
jgi:Flp pilus assembly protein TadG